MLPPIFNDLLVFLPSQWRGGEARHIYSVLIRRNTSDRPYEKKCALRLVYLDKMLVNNLTSLSALETPERENDRNVRRTGLLTHSVVVIFWARPVHLLCFFDTNSRTCDNCRAPCLKMRHATYGGGVNAAADGESYGTSVRRVEA